MAYCTLDDVKAQIEEIKLVQLTDDENTGAVVAARVTRAIADADAEIDGYVGSRHVVPLSPVPESIRRLSVELAIYNLYARRDKVPEHRAERYKSSVKLLEQIALGKISLGPHDPDGNPPASDAPELSSDNPVRAFTRASMSGF
ncbi:MAG: DUF1320 domain-containing protein [Syntrophobacteraceae bacterium]